MTKEGYEQRAYDWGYRERMKGRPLHLNPFTKGGGEYGAFHKGRRGLPMWWPGERAITVRAPKFNDRQR